MPPIEPRFVANYLTGSGVLEGVVYDAGQGPLEGASVRIRSCGSFENNHSTGGTRLLREFYVTGKDGKFRLEGLRAGRYQIDVVAPGFLRHMTSSMEELHRRLSAEKGGDVLNLHWLETGRWGADFESYAKRWRMVGYFMPEIAENETTKIDVLLRKGRRISGRVNVADAKPLKDAKVEVLEQGHWWPDADGRCYSNRGYLPPAEVLTDAEGRFVLFVGPDGTLKIKVSAPGYLFKQVDVDVLNHESPLEILMSLGNNITGSISTSDGTPVQNAEIHVFKGVDFERLHLARSNDLGVFEINDGPPPPFWVFAISDQGDGLQECLRAEDRIVIPVKASVVRGRLVDAQGAPLSGVSVMERSGLRVSNEWTEFPLGWRSMSNSRWAHSNEQGEFVVQVGICDGNKANLHFINHTKPYAEHMTQWLDVSQVHTILFVPNRSTPEPEAPTESPKEKTAKAPEKDVETRNADWIKWLGTAPPAERVEFLSGLRTLACGDCKLEEKNISSERLDLLPVFLAGLENDDGDTRFWAISAIHYMNHTETFPILLKALKHSDHSIRSYAVTGLRKFTRDPKLRPEALNALQDLFATEKQSFQVQVAAASALVDLGVPIPPEVFEYAMRSDGGYHSTAAGALARMGRKEAIELIILRMLKGTPWAHTWPSIEDSLATLTGQKLGTNWLMWKDWLEKNRGSLPPQVPWIAKPA